MSLDWADLCESLLTWVSVQGAPAPSAGRSCTPGGVYMSHMYIHCYTYKGGGRTPITLQCQALCDYRLTPPVPGSMWLQINPSCASFYVITNQRRVVRSVGCLTSHQPHLTSLLWWAVPLIWWGLSLWDKPFMVACDYQTGLNSWCII